MGFPAMPGLVVARARRPPRPEDLKWIKEGLDLAGMKGKPVFLLLGECPVDFKGRKAPDAKNVFGEMLAMLEQEAAAACIIFGINGFMASILRSAVTGVVMLRRSQIPLHVSGTVEDAVRWLGEKQPTVGESGFNAVIEAVRLAMQPDAHGR